MASGDVYPQATMGACSVRNENASSGVTPVTDRGGGACGLDAKSGAMALLASVPGLQPTSECKANKVGV